MIIIMNPNVIYSFGKFGIYPNKIPDHCTGFVVPVIMVAPKKNSCR